MSATPARAAARPSAMVSLDLRGAPGAVGMALAMLVMLRRRVRRRDPRRFTA